MEISSGVRKGMWSEEEDDLLRTCIQRYGEGKWHLVPQRAGLNRCRKSCRMRWLNYLKPGIKRGNFSDDEADMILRFHKLLGNRWSLIASRFPGRTSNDLKNYWNTHIRKKMGCSSSQTKEEKEEAVGHKVITPQPLNLSRKGLPDEAAVANACDGGVGVVVADVSAHQESAEKGKEWWERLLDDDLVINDEGNEKYSVPWSLSEEENKFMTQFWDDPN